MQKTEEVDHAIFVSGGHWLYIYSDYDAILLSPSRIWRFYHNEFFADDKEREFFLRFCSVGDNCPIESIVVAMRYPDDDDEWLATHSGGEATEADCYDYFADQLARCVLPRVTSIRRRVVCK